MTRRTAARGSTVASGNAASGNASASRCAASGVAASGVAASGGAASGVAASRVAANVAAADLGAYQQAARLVLTHDLITATRPGPGALGQVLRWADELTADLREVLGYTLQATTRQVRLVRRLDALDDTQTAIFARHGRPFDRRRLAYLCLILASFQRSRIEVSLADLVRAFTPAAAAIDGLGFDPTVTAHKAAVVDVLDWLAERGALRLSDGSAQAWAQDSERGDALYDIDHDIATALFRPARPVQHLTSAAGLLDASAASGNPGAQRAAAAQRAARALIEYPVVYYAQVEPEVAAALGGPGLADGLARLTGLAVERRAEGIALADSSGRFTDRPFPGRGGAVNRAAGLLLAKIADAIEEAAAARGDDPPYPPRAAARGNGSHVPASAASHGDAPLYPPRAAARGEGSRVPASSAALGDGSGTPASTAGRGDGFRVPASAAGGFATLPVPLEADDQRELLARVDSALPWAGVVQELAWSAPPGHSQAGGAPVAPAPAPPPGVPPGVPLVADSRLAQMMDELFDDLGAASFTVTWQHDPRGLLAAAVGFLSDLRLLRRVPGGVLVLPAAARYRDIKLALPTTRSGDSQLDLFAPAAATPASPPESTPEGSARGPADGPGIARESAR
ncbi:MAG TPA: DUF2398 family protein [Trebonia sp.]|nr:DUF2398 family protein [Trebonia sp.]